MQSSSWEGDGRKSHVNASPKKALVCPGNSRGSLRNLPAHIVTKQQANRSSHVFRRIILLLWTAEAGEEDGE